MPRRQGTGSGLEAFWTGSVVETKLLQAGWSSSSCVLEIEVNGQRWIREGGWQRRQLTRARDGALRGQIEQIVAALFGDRHVRNPAIALDGELDHGLSRDFLPLAPVPANQLDHRGQILR